VLERYKAAGGHYREVVLEGCGHGPVTERSADVAALIQEQVESAKAVTG
jgi:pimeloyl-ACP methyl ester carboxylesterase